MTTPRPTPSLYELLAQRLGQVSLQPGRGRAVRPTSAIANFREGYMDQGELALMLQQLGVPAEEIARYLLSADLDRRIETTALKAQALRELLRDKVLTLAQYEQGLLVAGVTPDHALLLRRFEAARQGLLELDAVEDVPPAQP